jgi:Family of unknown function (DUF6134)
VFKLLCVCFLVAAAYPDKASAATNGRSLVFDAYRAGKKIGSHSLQFTQSGDRLVVDIAIDFKGKAVIFPFSYAHRNREVWQGNKLLSLDSSTVSNGKKNTLSAKAESGQLKLLVDGKPATIDQIFSTSYWNPETVKQTRLLNSQKGDVIDIVNEGTATVIAPRADGGSIAVTEYKKSGTKNFNIAVSYDSSGCLSGMNFKAPKDITRISYKLVARPNAKQAPDLLANPLLKSCLENAPPRS